MDGLPHGENLNVLAQAIANFLVPVVQLGKNWVAINTVDRGLGLVEKNSIGSQHGLAWPKHEVVIAASKKGFNRLLA